MRAKAKPADLQDLHPGWLYVATAACSLAALGAKPEDTASGKFLGVIAALILLALVSSAFYLLVGPLLDKRHRDKDLTSALVILALLWFVKTGALMIFQGFGIDVGTYEAWALQIAGQGPAHTYQTGYFLDYPPGYLYALWAAGVIARLVGAGGSALRIVVESPALVADFFLALAVFASVRRSEHAGPARIAMLMVALNPALLFDTVIWGQSDSVLTLVMWLCVTAILASEFALAWALAAIAVLVKPQGLMLLPVLGWWTLLEARSGTWWRSALTLAGVFIIGIAPFQIGHPWNWIIDLYTSTAAYYHETSVNAFNLMALIGGLRQPDSGTALGLSYFALGMGLLVPLYAFAAYLLWRMRTARGLYFGCFLVLFGFFMVAPRMHERYLYPALVFAVPAALESADMFAVFLMITVTCLVNLAYVKHALETVVFLQARDGVAMFCSVLNVAAFALAVHYGFTSLQRETAAEKGRPDFLGRISSAFKAPPARPVPDPPPLPWLRVDTLVMVALILAAAAIRFWHLGTPPEIVFDEVHFVGQARHYLHGEQFLDPHPPLAKLVIALGIWLFGDHPWSWRFGNAVIGTLLVPITYHFARRVFNSRIGAALAGAFVLCDGMFLVDSRIAVIDIVYLTCAAAAYALLFRFIQTTDLLGKRRILPWIGVALGLTLGSKLYVPAFTCLLMAGFIAYNLWTAPAERGAPRVTGPYRERRIVAAVAMVAAVTAAVYLLTFLPHYLIGWWGGMADLFDYYKQVVWYENSVASATHPYASPWWSWPLMLRPVAYWQKFPKVGDVSTVWGGGNPLLWWGALTAITITAVHALERRETGRSFLVIGYLGYVAIWVWIGRTLFLYHYMASVYLGFVALGGVLGECWEGAAEPWEHIALLVTMGPACVLGLGALPGTILFAAILAAYSFLLASSANVGKFVCVAFVTGAAILFVYFFPVWTAIPIARTAYYARMWLQDSGLRNWI